MHGLNEFTPSSFRLNASIKQNCLHRAVRQFKKTKQSVASVRLELPVRLEPELPVRLELMQRPLQQLQQLPLPLLLWMPCRMDTC